MKFTVTTPIYYVNDKPHIGHLYTTVAADVLARYHRLRGEDVFFLTGTDENSQKNVEAAEKAGYTDIQIYLDTMSAVWEKTWKDLDITFDAFIRTTDDVHKKGVEKFWRAVFDRGDIYEGVYEGWYCDGCEAFYLESDLQEGSCPLHKKPAKRLKEKNWFFRVSAYREKLLNHIDEHPDFIRPTSRRNEIRSFIEKFMEDFSISREGAKWGIPVPNDPKSVVYVWFDALVNYLTGIGYGSDDAQFDKHWPADLHLVGKDIIKFHCAYWPAMLMSAGLPLPKSVFAHGFFTIDGQKMSKSLGNAIDPHEVSAKYGKDVLRYFLLKEVPFGEDGDFSMVRLGERYATDLGGTFGNLVHRVLSMTEKYNDGKVPNESKTRKINDEEQIKKSWNAYEEAMNSIDFSSALDVIWNIFREANRAIDTEKPWETAKTDPEKCNELLYSLLEKLRHGALMLIPFMPDITVKTIEQLGLEKDILKKDYADMKTWGGLSSGTLIKKGEPLFPRQDV